MNNKNVQLINQNIYIIQFIYIMNAFIIVIKISNGNLKNILKIFFIL